MLSASPTSKVNDSQRSRSRPYSNNVEQNKMLPEWIAKVQQAEVRHSSRSWNSQYLKIFCMPQMTLQCSEQCWDWAQRVLKTLLVLIKPNFSNLILLRIASYTAWSKSPTTISAVLKDRCWKIGNIELMGITNARNYLDRLHSMGDFPQESLPLSMICQFLSERTVRKP